MQTRPVTLDDVPAITELQSRWDTAFLGAPEHSEDEVREFIQRLDSFADDSHLVLSGERVVGLGLRWSSDTWLVVDPELDTAPVHAELLSWFAAGRAVPIDALSTDPVLRGALVEAGWRHAMSSFELIRQVSPELVLAEPSWPDGITVGFYRPDVAAAVHRLIYVDAAWAEVPGHPYRGFEEWQRIFATDKTVPEQQVVAWRDERLVGVAMGRIWDDGTGWVSQLATAKDERGKGIGRALLLESLRRRRDAGASSLGLSVQAGNRSALTLYLDAGLTIDREWMAFEQPSQPTTS